MISPSPRQLRWDDCMDLLQELPSMPLDDRAEAIETLVRNPSPGIRERALRVGVAVLPDDTLVGYLRSDADAVLRNAALEILKAREGRSFQLAVELLRDDSDDVALQAVLILDHIKDPRAVEPLRGVLGHSDVNVVQATIVALGHLGDGRTIGDLMPFLDADPWLQMAAIQALGDLRSPQAIPALEPLLTDLMAGPMAAEAIAQIGGPEAFGCLARHWLSFQRELDPETSLGLLAHVLEGLAATPEPIEDLRAGLADRLRDPFHGVRVSAARCLLALGAGPEDGEALNLLAAARQEDDIGPSCLARRSDLVSYLLSKPGRLRSWGFLLAAKYPETTDRADLAAALLDHREPPTLEPVVRALEAIHGGEIAAPLLDLFLRSSREDRGALSGILLRHRETLEAAATERSDMERRDHLVLASLLGRPADELAAALLELPESERLEVTAELTDNAALMRRLPWQQWLEKDPDAYSELACEAAIDSRLHDLLAPLRRLLATRPSIEIVRAVGELGDRESVAQLLELAAADGGSPILRPLIVESLGRIGGPEARRALRELAAADDEKLARLAYRALASCAAEEDDDFFRAAVGHPDWYVRLSAAEVLGRFVRTENLDALSQLAADPVLIVARHAIAALREEGRAG